ncbi:hypothetical protein [Streptomyces sp. NPDC005799]|uniref:hypothetical protein n=1 Tax=Streptomyces sp. NPDC005799 TaxID=3154678 RepID=UPI0033F65A9F
MRNPALENQLGGLGSALNTIRFWTARYIDAAIAQFQTEEHAGPGSWSSRTHPAQAPGRWPQTSACTEQAFTPASASDLAIAALRDRVRVSARTDNDSRSSVVKVTSTDGTERVVGVDVNRPTPASELDRRWESLVTKFHSLVDLALGADAADRIVSEVAGLATAESLGPLLRTLAGDREDVRAW